MSWVFIAAVVALVAAVVLIEWRAVRMGDERLHHAPGYALVLGGLISIGVGIASAAAELTLVALLASGAGLVAVVLGATRQGEVSAH